MYRTGTEVALFSVVMLAMMVMAGICYTLFWLPVRLSSAASQKCASARRVGISER